MGAVAKGHFESLVTLLQSVAAVSVLQLDTRRDVAAQTFWLEFHRGAAGNMGWRNTPATNKTVLQFMFDRRDSRRKSWYTEPPTPMMTGHDDN